MKAVDVERAERRVDEAVELGDELGLLMLIVTHDEIHRVDRTRRDLRVK